MIQVRVRRRACEQMNVHNKQANPAATLSTALPAGSKTQQVTAMPIRVPILGDKNETSEVCAQQKRRSMHQQLLDEKYNQLDQTWNQNFIVGSKVVDNSVAGLVC